MSSDEQAPHAEDPAPVLGTFQYRLLSTDATPDERIPDLANIDRGWLRETLTRMARDSVTQARAAVLRWHRSELSAEFLLLGILNAAPVPFFLSDSPDRAALISDLEATLGLGVAPRPEMILATDDILYVLTLAREEAQERGRERCGRPYNRIGIGPLLLALAHRDNTTTSGFLARYGITYDRLRSELPLPTFTL